MEKCWLSSKEIDTLGVVLMILIMAWGNSLRRDDGAGLVLAEKLEQLCLTRRLKVRRIAVQQPTPELAEIIAGTEVTDVVFVDTRAISKESSKQKIQVQQLSLGNPSPSSGHHLDPSALMLYACRLYDKRPSAWIVSVPGADFGHGEGLSEISRQAIVEVSDAFVGKMLDFSCKIRRS
jgi:hydrogenase maturation protease